VAEPEDAGCAGSRFLFYTSPARASSGFGRLAQLPVSSQGSRVKRRQVADFRSQVFTYEGQPIRQVSTRAWYRALERAGIEDFRWHDLRHTWASWHVQSGTPLFALQELGGWETETMVRRYAHLAAEHLAVYANNTESHGTNTAQPPDFRGTVRLPRLQLAKS